MANQHFGARLADAPVVVVYENAAERMGSGSSFSAGWRSSVRGSVILHATISIGWETVPARTGLTVGCFPHVRFFRSTDSATRETR
jgi:hypothetical protein